MLIPKFARYAGIKTFAEARKHMKRRFGRTRRMLESAVSAYPVYSKTKYKSFTERFKPDMSAPAPSSKRKFASKKQSRFLHEDINILGQGFAGYEELAGHGGEVYVSFDPGITIRITDSNLDSMAWEFPDATPAIPDTVEFDIFPDEPLDIPEEDTDNIESYVISNIVEMKNLSEGVYTFAGAAKLHYNGVLNRDAHRVQIARMDLADSDFSGIRVAMKESANGRAIKGGTAFRWI